MSEAAVARASALLDVGRAPEAIGLLGAALSQAPESHPLLCLLSRAHGHTGDYAEAARVAERAIAVNPEEAEAYYLASFALHHLRRHRRAIELAREAVRLAPTEWWTHAGLAAALAGKHGLPFSRKYARRAMVEARRAVELAPDEPDAHLALGYCAQEVNRRREAKAAYERVLALQPGDTVALNNLSAVQLSAGRPVVAVRGFQTVAAGGPHTALAQHNIDRVALWLLGAVFVGLYALAKVLDLADESDWPRSTYAAVDWGGLLVIAVAAATAVRRLPKAVRTYYRRLALRRGLIGLLILLMLVAYLALLLSALPTGGELRLLLRDVGRAAWGCLIVIQVVAWAGKGWVERRRARTGV